MSVFLTCFWPAVWRCVVKILVGLCLGKNILCFGLGKTYYALAWENILCFGLGKTYYALAWENILCSGGGFGLGKDILC
jgi:hypothetical protein